MNPTALIADDEPLLREILEARLAAAWPELQILAMAEDGLQATELALTHAPDIMFLDIKMPGINGLDLLEKIREQKKELLVVIMTAEASMKNAVEAMKRGAYDYITKPFNRDELRLTVAKALQLVAAGHAGAAHAAAIAGAHDLVAAGRQRRNLGRAVDARSHAANPHGLQALTAAQAIEASTMPRHSHGASRCASARLAA